MACEWTHHISYQPGLIAVSLGHTKATVENIRTSKEFGVNLCASDQSILASVACGYTGAKYDKVNAFTFFLNYLGKWSKLLVDIEKYNNNIS
jgi:flavin reductase (DIM6/NTAB) family NADH-FMN oxidoreductase RutF